MWPLNFMTMSQIIHNTSGYFTPHISTTQSIEHDDNNSTKAHRLCLPIVLHPYEQWLDHTTPHHIIPGNLYNCNNIANTTIFINTWNNTNVLTVRQPTETLI